MPILTFMSLLFAPAPSSEAAMWPSNVIARGSRRSSHGDVIISYPRCDVDATRCETPHQIVGTAMITDDRHPKIAGGYASSLRMVGLSDCAARRQAPMDVSKSRQKLRIIYTMT
jgi:hypothetical protein